MYRSSLNGSDLGLNFSLGPASQAYSFAGVDFVAPPYSMKWGVELSAYPYGDQATFQVDGTIESRGGFLFVDVKTVGDYPAVGITSYFITTDSPNVADLQLQLMNRALVDGEVVPVSTWVAVANGGPSRSVAFSSEFPRFAESLQYDPLLSNASPYQGESSGKSSGTDLGMIVGIAVGGTVAVVVLALVIIAGLALMACSRKQRNRQEEQELFRDRTFTM